VCLHSCICLRCKVRKKKSELNNGIQKEIIAKEGKKMEKRIIEVKGKKKKGSSVLMKVFLTQETKCKLITYKNKVKRERIANAGGKKEGKKKIEEKGQKKKFACTEGRFRTCRFCKHLNQKAYVLWENMTIACRHIRYSVTATQIAVLISKCLNG
jgi:methylphosphotriester-DNA--protein-cysteine methyltransferase